MPKSEKVLAGTVKTVKFDMVANADGKYIVYIDGVPADLTADNKEKEYTSATRGFSRLGKWAEANFLAGHSDIVLQGSFSGVVSDEAVIVAPSSHDTMLEEAQARIAEAGRAAAKAATEGDNGEAVQALTQAPAQATGTRGK